SDNVRNEARDRERCRIAEQHYACLANVAHNSRFYSINLRDVRQDTSGIDGGEIPHLPFAPPTRPANVLSLSRPRALTSQRRDAARRAGRAAEAAGQRTARGRLL